MHISCDPPAVLILENSDSDLIVAISRPKQTLMRMFSSQGFDVQHEKQQRQPIWIGISRNGPSYRNSTACYWATIVAEALGSS